MWQLKSFEVVTLQYIQQQLKHRLTNRLRVATLDPIKSRDVTASNVKVPLLRVEMSRQVKEKAGHKHAFRHVMRA